MRTILVCACIMMLCGCAEGPFDPSFINPSFQGITVTDESGNVLGPVDELDWQVHAGPTPYPVLRTDRTVRMATPVRAAKLLPTQVAAYPAYPNPNNGLFVGSIAVPVECIISVWLIDSNFSTIWFIVDHNVNAGVWEFEFSLSQIRRRIPSGVYRLVYEIQHGEDLLNGYGDVRVIIND